MGGQTGPYLPPSADAELPTGSRGLKIIGLIEFLLLLPAQYPIAFSLDFDHRTVVHESVDDGGSDGVIVEGLSPVLEGALTQRLCYHNDVVAS